VFLVVVIASWMLSDNATMAKVFVLVGLLNMTEETVEVCLSVVALASHFHPTKIMFNEGLNPLKIPYSIHVSDCQTAVITS
jgi:hypothetical protein